MAVSTRSFVLQGFALAFGTTLLGACVVDPTATTGDDRVTEEQGTPAPETIADDGSVRVCTGEKHCYTRVKTDEHGQRKQALAAPAGWGATDIQKAYGVTNTGSTATIAVIDAYGYSALAADLAVYRTQYGLPACTVASGCLTIVNQSGSTSGLPANAPSSDDWTAETALDVDMASSGCPSCKILVVQATNDSGDGLDVGNNTAASMGAAVISNSWGGAESSGVTSEETYFNHPGIAIFVAAGDDGYTGSSPDYPSTSAHTIAVGGTTLASASTSRGYGETAWNDGGSSCSKYIAIPSWQTATTKCSGKRMASDVSAVANGNEGIAIYDSLNGNGGWTQVEGTSAASPLVASIYAATKHGTVTAQFAYQNPTAYYDVTSGTNGSCSSDKICTAGTGWDGPTGVGTPNFAALAALSGTSSGSGSGSGSEGSGSDSGSNSSTGSGSGSDEGSGSDSGSGEGSNEGGSNTGSGEGDGGTCGNGVIDQGEECDNGQYNGTPGNSCTADCQLVGGDNDNGGGSSGGGCASTNGQGAASLVVVLGFALIRRRRRSIA